MQINKRILLLFISVFFVAHYVRALAPKSSIIKFSEVEGRTTEYLEITKDSFLSSTNSSYGLVGAIYMKANKTRGLKICAYNPLGTTMVAYYFRENGELVLAFRGADMMPLENRIAFGTNIKSYTIHGQSFDFREGVMKLGQSICGDVEGVIDFCRRRYHVREITFLGYCLGGNIANLLAVLVSEKLPREVSIKNIMMASSKVGDPAWRDYCRRSRIKMISCNVQGDLVASFPYSNGQCRDLIERGFSFWGLKLLYYMRFFKESHNLVPLSDHLFILAGNDVLEVCSFEEIDRIVKYSVESGLRALEHKSFFKHQSETHLFKGLFLSIQKQHGVDVEAREKQKLNLGQVSLKKIMKCLRIIEHASSLVNMVQTQRISVPHQIFALAAGLTGQPMFLMPIGVDIVNRLFFSAHQTRVGFELLAYVGLDQFIGGGLLHVFGIYKLISFLSFLSEVAEYSVEDKFFIQNHFMSLCVFFIALSASNPVFGMMCFVGFALFLKMVDSGIDQSKYEEIGQSDTGDCVEWLIGEEDIESEVADNDFLSFTKTTESVFALQSSPLKSYLSRGYISISA